MALDRIGQVGPVSCAHPTLQGITSPLTDRLAQWGEVLAGHSDGQFVQYVLEGLEHGFHVGCTASTSLSDPRGNLLSTRLHPEVIDDYLLAEIREGRMLGPFPPGEVPGLHVNHMGVVPKGHTPVRWRLITDLSYPEGMSVNDDIRPELCSLTPSSAPCPERDHPTPPSPATSPKRLQERQCVPTLGSDHRLLFRSGEIIVPSVWMFDERVHLAWGDVMIGEDNRSLRVFLKHTKYVHERNGDVYWIDGQRPLSGPCYLGVCGSSRIITGCILPVRTERAALKARFVELVRQLWHAAVSQWVAT